MRRAWRRAWAPVDAWRWRRRLTALRGVLDQLEHTHAKGGSAWMRVLLAANDLIQQIASDPRLPDTEQARIVAVSIDYYRRELAGNPQLCPAVLARFMADPGQWGPLVHRAARRVAREESLQLLAACPDPRVRTLLLTNPHASDELKTWVALTLDTCEHPL